MSVKELPGIIREIYSLVHRLEGLFEGRHFTPDGHMVGSLGEVIVSHYYNLELMPASCPGYDALSSDGSKASAVWQATSAAAPDVWSRSAEITDNTASWGTATILSDTTTFVNSPQIALSSDGTSALAVWRQYVSSSVVPLSKSATIAGNTATWGATTTLSTTAGSDIKLPQVALSSDGVMGTVAWCRHRVGTGSWHPAWPAGDGPRPAA